MITYKKTSTVEETIFEIAKSGDIYEFQTINLNKIDLNKQNNKGHTLLMISACNGHREFSRYLLELGANPNLVDNTGTSALMIVAAKGHSEIAKFLIEKGADINYKNSSGETALNYAQEFNHNDVGNLIKSYEAKPEVWGFLDSLRNLTSILNYRR